MIFHAKRTKTFKIDRVKLFNKMISSIYPIVFSAFGKFIIH